MRKRIVLFAIVASVLSSLRELSTLTVEAACSGWTREDGWQTTCDWSDRCGPFWTMPGTCYEVGTKTRYCDVDGKQVKETTSFVEQNGCCA